VRIVVKLGRRLVKVPADLYRRFIIHHGKAYLTLNIIASDNLKLIAVQLLSSSWR
jgi:hypothetical protein